MQTKFSKLIGGALVREQMSKEKLCHLTGINKGRMHRLMGGEDRPTDLECDMIGKVLKIDSRTVAYMSVRRSDVPEEKRELWDLLGRFTQDLTLEIYPGISEKDN